MHEYRPLHFIKPCLLSYIKCAHYNFLKKNMRYKTMTKIMYNIANDFFRIYNCENHPTPSTHGNAPFVNWILNRNAFTIFIHNFLCIYMHLQ